MNKSGVISCPTCKNLFTTFSEKIVFLEVHLDDYVSTFEYCSLKCAESKIENATFPIPTVLEKRIITKEKPLSISLYYKTQLKVIE